MGGLNHPSPMSSRASYLHVTLHNAHSLVAVAGSHFEDCNFVDLNQKGQDFNSGEKGKRMLATAFCTRTVPCCCN